MKADIIKDENIKKEENTSFMLPIWIITLITMAGTSFACYAYYGYDLNKRHSENMAEVKLIEARIETHEKYLNIIKKDGKVEAIKYLNNN